MNNNYQDNDFKDQEVLSEEEIKERQERKRAKGQYYEYNRNNYNYDYRNNTGYDSGTNNGMTSLVLGIISLFCIFLGQASFIGTIIAIVGLIVGVDARNNGDRTYAKTGIILNTIAVAATLLVTVACIAFVSCVGCSLMNYMW